MLNNRWIKHALWIIPLAILDVWLLTRLFSCREAAEQPVSPVAAVAGEPEPVALVASPWRALCFPTEYDLLNRRDPSIFQPTASGKPESALFGSTRTAGRGGKFWASFHEGVDIAAAGRDRQGRPLDKVKAIAPGIVSYVNGVGGNSNYGKYVVVMHEDSSIGDVYSLYAHLADVESGLKGRRVEAGDVLGTMGNTSSSPIPMVRAHLHLEIGLMLNSRFARWYRARKMKPDHGNHHGHNLVGVDPLIVFEHQRQNDRFDFASHLALTPVAFEIVIAAKQKPDFFRRHPVLWSGEYRDGEPIHLACSENGLPLRGRAASEEERRLLAGNARAVVRVDEYVLGRNGSRLVVKSRGSWKIGAAGLRWLERLTY